MSRRYRAREADGFTLLESIAYTALIAVVVQIALGSFVSAVRLNQVAMGALDRARETSAFTTAYRELVRQSLGVLPTLGLYATAEQTLVLALPPRQTGGTARYAVVNVIPPEGDGADPETTRLRVLKLAESHGELVAESVQAFRVAAPAVSFRMDEEASRAALVTLNFLDEKGEPRSAVSATIRAHRPQAIATVLASDEGGIR